ncbi:MAG: EI24 domain-containing protein [Croceibacterium sp.]
MTSLPTSLLRGAGALAEGAVLRLLMKTVLLTLAIFAVLGVAGFYGLDAGLAWAGLEDDRGASALLAVAVTIIAGWLLFRVVALAVLQFFADEVVSAVERRSYPAAAAEARKLGLGAETRLALRGAARALLANLIALPFALALLFTAIGPAVVFWAVNAWLLGRELVDMVWLRHCPAPGAPSPVGRAERFLLGGAVAALFMIPFANLLAPILGAAAATHLVHGRLQARHAA